MGTYVLPEEVLNEAVSVVVYALQVGAAAPIDLILEGAQHQVGEDGQMLAVFLEPREGLLALDCANNATR